MRCGGASTYAEAEGREQGGKGGEHDVDDDAPLVLLFLSHNGTDFFKGFILYGYLRGGGGARRLARHYAMRDVTRGITRCVTQGEALRLAAYS